MKLIDNKRIKKNLERAKELEEKPLMPNEELLANYRKNATDANALQKLLTPAWWISEKDEKKNRKHTKARKKPTRKN